MEKVNRITLKLRGLDEDNGDVRLNDFVQELQILKNALTETQKLISENNFAYFKIVGLQKNSPAQVVLEAVPLKEEYSPYADALVDAFFSNITDIENNRYPARFTHETFDSYSQLTSLREKKKLTEIVISRDGETPNYLPDFSKKIEGIMGEDDYEIGSYSGMLDAINIHNQNIFYIYPTSHLPKLKCVFSSELKIDAVKAIGKYVTVSGQKRSMSNIHESHPYEMRVRKIEIHPDDGELPSLRDLKGIAPNITDNQSSESFIRGIRNEW